MEHEHESYRDPHPPMGNGVSIPGILYSQSANKRTKKQASKTDKAQMMQLVDLDTSRELPIKKPLSAYVHFLNEVSVNPLWAINLLAQIFDT